MAAEKKAFEAVAGKTSVQITLGDGSTLELTPGEPYVTSDAYLASVLERADSVKSVPVPGMKAKEA